MSTPDIAFEAQTCGTPGIERPSTTQSRLPVELLLEVFHYLPTAKDKSSLARTNRHHHRQLNFELYRYNVREQNSSCLEWCVRKGCLDALELAKSAGANLEALITEPPKQRRGDKVDPGAVGLQSYTPLHLAAFYGDVKVARWLLDNGANKRGPARRLRPDSLRFGSLPVTAFWGPGGHKELDSRTFWPLHTAIDTKQEDMVELLLERKCSWRVLGRAANGFGMAGFNALKMAAGAGLERTVRYISKTYKPRPLTYYRVIFHCVENLYHFTDKKMIALLLGLMGGEAVADPGNLLSASARGLNFVAALELLRHRSFEDWVNSETDEAREWIRYAFVHCLWALEDDNRSGVPQETEEFMVYLLDRDPSLARSFSVASDIHENVMTLLYLAPTSSSLPLSVTRLLLRRGGDPNAKYPDGAFHLAGCSVLQLFYLYNAHLDHIRLLLDHGARAGTADLLRYLSEAWAGKWRKTSSSGQYDHRAWPEEFFQPGRKRMWQRNRDMMELLLEYSSRAQPHVVNRFARDCFSNGDYDSFRLALKAGAHFDHLIPENEARAIEDEAFEEDDPEPLEALIAIGYYKLDPPDANACCCLGNLLGRATSGTAVESMLIDRKVRMLDEVNDEALRVALRTMIDARAFWYVNVGWSALEYSGIAQ